MSRNLQRAQRTSYVLAVIGWLFILLAVTAMFYVGLTT